MSDSSDLRTAPTIQVDRISGDAETLAGGPGQKVAGPFKRGDRIGRYVVLEERGRGGMGVVYAAYDPELDRRVALKLLRPRVMGGVRHTDPEARALLIHEAQSAAKLRHPNVTAVHDVGQTEAGSVFLAMEYVDGQDLRHWLAETPPWREVLEVFVDAGRGLEAAHAAGIIHRDFKPGNVMRDAAGQVMVTDFGLAQALRRDGAPELVSVPPSDENAPTVESLPAVGEGIVGTPAYMPPEQYQGQAADERSDVFAFCVSLYEGLYGELPFQGRSIAELVQQVKTGEVEVPKDREVPSWLRKAVLKGLAPRPEERWASMTPLLAALSRDPAARRHRVLAIAGGSIALIAIGASLGGPDPDPWCVERRDAIDSAWGSKQRSQLAPIFGGQSETYGDELWQKTAEGIDGFVDTWSTVGADLCKSADRIDRTKRLAVQTCLELRRTELEVVVALLAEGDPEIIGQAVGLVLAMDSPLLCSNAERPEYDAGGRTDPAMRERAVEIGVALRRASLQRFVGRYDAAAQSVQAALDVLPLDDRSTLRAEVYLFEASLHRHGGEYSEQHKALIEALRIALAANSGRLIAQTMVDLSHAELRGDADPEAARQWAYLAGGVVQDVGGDPELEVRIHNAFGAAYIKDLQWVEARDALLRAQQAAVDTPFIPVLLHEAIENNLGAAYASGGDLERARVVFAGQVERRQDRYGPHHHHLHTPLLNLARAHQKLGNYEEGLAAAKRLTEILERIGGIEAPSLVAPLGLMADAYSSLNEVSKSIAARERARAIALEHLDPNAQARYANDIDLIYKYGYVQRTAEALAVADELVEVTSGSGSDTRLAKALSARSDARRQGRDFDGSLADADEAIAILGRIEAKPTDVSEAYYERGLTLNALGRAEEALAALDHALAVAQPEPTYFAAKTIGHRGHSLRRLGRFDEAIVAFESAIDFAERHGPRKDICWAQINLAEVLSDAGVGHDRAVKLARTVAASPGQDEEAEYCRRHANQWLAEHDAELRDGSERDTVRAP